MLKNEKGYALVIVLLALVLVVVLSSYLMSSTLSSRKQVNQSEEEIQAIDLAEMGVAHYITAIEDALENENDEDKKISNLKNIPPMSSYSLNTNSNYQYIITPEACVEISNDEITCEFKSKGKVENKEHLLSGTIIITTPSEIPSPPPFPEDENTAKANGYEIQDIIDINETWVNLKKENLYVKGIIHIKNQSKLLMEGYNLWVNGDVSLDTKAELKAGNAKFSGSNITLDTHAKITISGNAIFTNPVISTKNDSKITIEKNAFFHESDIQLAKHYMEKICVNGKAYYSTYNENNEQVWVEYEGGERWKYFDKSCYGKNTTTPNNGHPPYEIQTDINYYQ